MLAADWPQSEKMMSPLEAVCVLVCVRMCVLSLFPSHPLFLTHIHTPFQTHTHTRARAEDSDRGEVMDGRQDVGRCCVVSW